MIIIKPKNLNIKETLLLCVIYLTLFYGAIINNDSMIALTSAFFGITYTFLAGKGNPICYILGLMGSGFYCYLSYKNALWGNLILYLCYYIPMQILGFFKWNKHLKKDKSGIVKIELSFKERMQLILINIVLCFFVVIVLNQFGDKYPFIDGITTVLSITGMYLTVKRAIEQWLVWIIVNGLSLIMWLKILMNGEKVFSTVIMWAVYFILAIYFYIIWHRDIKSITFNR